MSLEVDVTGPLRVAASLRGISTATVQKSEQRAKATLLRRLPVAARRDIQQQYTVRAGKVTEGLSVKQAGGNVVLMGRGRAIGLQEFKHTASRGRGVTSQLQKRFSPVAIGAAFRGPNGGLFQRVEDSGSASGHVGRLPIRKLYGPSVAYMLRNTERRARLGDMAAEILSVEINRLVASALRG